jgi:predicted amidohydrolase YtcJ
MNPVMLTHASGHAIIVNKKAMELAGITSETENPEGGRIVRNEKGEAIGVFEENAEKLIRSVYDEQQKQRTPEDIQNEKIREAKLAVQECLSNGITSLTDAGSDFATIDFFKEMIDQNILKIRLNVMVQEDNNELRDNLDKYKITGYGNDHLRVGSIKKYMDGALGSRGAWMFEPYSDLPDHTGEAVTPLGEMRETARIAAQKGFQLCAHAIGDRANHEVLNIYDRIFKTTPDTIDYRWRIEHAQHLSPSDIPRFGELGVIAAMQGIHCTSDAPFVIERIGEERAEQGAYAWRKLIDAGATICNGTDSPIEKVNPIACYYASVTRQLNDGTYFFPEEKMTREEALRSYTINGAYASFEENKKGTLSVGKLADVTVLDTDLLSASEEEIKNAKVIFTIIGGEVLYKFSNVDPDGENAN